MKLKYYTLEAAYDEIRRHCPNKIGFENAFAQTTMFFIHDLINCIDNNIPADRSTYDEPLDFLDGNGFIVEGDENKGYTIKLMEGES